MSSVFAKVVEVKEVRNAENSDNLSLINCLGWWVISSKNSDGSHRYKVGQPVIYIEVDSLLDRKFIEFFFKNSKIAPDSPEKHRVRSIRIRKNLSQGIILDPQEQELLNLYPKLKNARLGDDVADILNIKKWEPPVSSLPRGMQVQNVVKRHPLFKEYTDIDNFRRYSDVLENGEEIVATLKLHGTSCRAAMLERYPINFLEKILKFFKLLPKWEYAIGSRRVQVNRRKDFTGFYGEDVYTKAVLDAGLIDKLEPNVQLFMEIVGKGIQSFNYGFDKHRVFVYDVMKDGIYLDYDDAKKYCQEKEIEMVPELYRGPYSEEVIHKLRNANDHELDKNVPCREGVVFKPIKERNSHQIGRVILKAISDEYYMQKDVTDFH